MPYSESDVATALRMKRAKYKISRERLSKETGIPPTTLASYENGSNTMSLENAVILADYYKTSLDDLIERKSLGE